MIFTDKTEQHVITAMQKGARLWFHYAYHPDFGTSCYLVELERDGQRLKLNTSIRNDESYWNERSECSSPRHFEMLCCADASEITGRIIHRDDVRQEYAGWQSDSAGAYRMLYVHNSTPTPRWITEQWDYAS